MRVRGLRLWIVALLLASSSGAWAQQRSKPRRDSGAQGQDDGQANREDEAKRAAALAAGKWLETFDAGNYGRAFEEMAPALAKAIDSAEWEAATGAFRTPLGRALGRRPTGIQYLKSEPTEIALQLSSTTRIFQQKQVALPYREWVLLQCQARFENASGVMLETVQLAKDDDGAWKVTGIRIEEGR